MEQLVNTGNGQQTVSDAERAWLSAMIEAEGSITLNVNARSGRIQGLRVTPRIIFTNTDNAIIAHYIALLEKAGIGKHVRQTKANNVRHSNLVGRAYKDITYVSVDGFKRVVPLLEAILPYMVGDKKERAKVLHRFVMQRLAYSEASGSTKGNFAYREDDVLIMLEFLRLTKSSNYESIAGMLNEHTREAKDEHRKAMKRIYWKAAADRGYVRPSRRALVSRESVRADRNDQPPA